MFYRLIKLLLSIFYFLIAISTGYAQDIPRLCICFESNTQYINVKTQNDSTYTNFSIAREGFETKRKRKKARDEWREGPPTESRYPYFYYKFYSVDKPQTKSAINEIEDCVDVVSVDEYRKKNFRPPTNARSSLVIFIQKLQNGTFIKWDAVQEAIE